MKTLVIALCFTLAFSSLALARNGSVIIETSPDITKSPRIYITDQDARGDTWTMDTQTGKTWYELNDHPQRSRSHDSAVRDSIIFGDDDDDD